MKAIIWSKENCTFCVQAKQLLESKGIEFEERKIGKAWTKEQLLDCVSIIDKTVAEFEK